MPYQSEKQRKFMHAQHPGIAAKWDAESRSRMTDERAGMGRREAATGAGAVGVGAGLVGGGVPGIKSDVLVDDLRRAKGVRAKTKAGWHLGRAGIFGHRANIHGVYRNFELSDQGINRRFPGTGKRPQLSRALEAGKRAPETKVIRHLKNGRLISNGLLMAGAGGLAYGATRPKKVEKADRQRRSGSTTLAAGGGSLAALSVGGSALADSQGRKWVKRAGRDMDAARKIDPVIGGYNMNPGYNKKLGDLRVPRLTPHLSTKEAVASRRLRQLQPDQIKELGRLRGAAVNQSHFGEVYGKTGRVFRKYTLPVGLAAGAVGGAGMALDHHRRRPVAKSETYGFGVSKSSGGAKRQRQRANLASQARERGISQSELRSQRVAANTRQAGELTAKKTAHRAALLEQRTTAGRKPSGLFRLSNMKIPGGRLGAGAALIGAGAGAGAAAGHSRTTTKPRNARDTERAAAVGAGGAYGAYYAGGNAAHLGVKRLSNDPVSNKVMGIHREQMHMPAGKLAGGHVPQEQIRQFYRTTPVGVRGAGTRRVLARTHGVSRLGRMALPVALAGGVAGATYESSKKRVAKGDADYPFLPSNIRQEVEWGIPETRQNPISPLQMIAGANIAAEGYTDLKRKWPFGKKKRRERGMFKLGVAEQLSPSSMGLVGT